MTIRAAVLGEDLRQRERAEARMSAHPDLTIVLGTRWPFTGVSRALRPRETPKKSEKSLPGPEAPGPPESLEKVWKKSGESEKGLEKVPKDFFETFSRLSGGPGAGGPGRLFSDFFGLSGPETPVNGQRVPKTIVLMLVALVFDI